MLSFLTTEREQAGWRFLLLWLIATNLGFFAGLIPEILIAKQPTLYLAVPLAAIGQAYVINRHISIYLPWAVGTAIFWIIGLLIGNQILNPMTLPDNIAGVLIYLATISAIGGLLAGIPQWVFMRDWLPDIGLWWLLVSAVAWTLLLPGVITGVLLMRYITADKIPMDGRHYELSGEY